MVFLFRGIFRFWVWIVLGLWFLLLLFLWWIPHFAYQQYSTDESCSETPKAKVLAKNLPYSFKCYFYCYTSIFFVVTVRLIPESDYVCDYCTFGKKIEEWAGQHTGYIFQYDLPFESRNRPNLCISGFQAPDAIQIAAAVLSTLFFLQRILSVP